MSASKANKETRGARDTSRGRKSAEYKTIVIEVSPEEEAAIEEARKATGLESQTELLTAAFAILTWAIDQVRRGNIIGGYNPHGGEPEIHKLEIPALENIKALPAPTEEKE